MDLNELTPEQQAQLKAQVLEEERQRLAAIDADREAYKALVSEKVDEIFPVLESVSESLSKTKQSIYDEFAEALKIKLDLFQVSDTQNSHTFMNKKGDRRIVLGYNTIDDYDDTVTAGVEKVRQFIASLATDEKSKMMADAISRLLASDTKGNLKPSRVMQLRRMAEQSDDALFLEGIQTIEKAYKPTRSKTYIRAERKNGNGVWVAIALGMTEAKGDHDDTIEGIGKVRQYLASLAVDVNSTQLADSINKLLVRDPAGNLQPFNVSQLRQMAERSNDKLFLEGIQIIEKACSKTYIRAEGGENGVG